MKTFVVALMILAACSTFAGQDETPTPARKVTFFDVLDLPARIDGPKLQKTADETVLKCAVANRSGESLVGLRLTMLFVDSSSGRVTRITWNEATEVPAYSIKSLEFHPKTKDETKDANVFLGIDEVIGRESVWRTVDADKLLRAYARGQHGQIPKVQKLQNTFDPRARVISRQLPPPKP